MSRATQEPATVRCAIYTRKSTEEGLEQEFNSLDAQREAGEAFIASQRMAGWTCSTERYDDGGFSGGNADRPALKRLLEDIEAGLVDCVVVYKVDRLSRSLLDFARMMETFERHGVSFVSVTQQFNTAHSMGRLTLNILLSFAQFEREIISERTRDKIAAARKKGKWAGGRPVLGYVFALEPWREVLDGLDALRRERGMQVVLIAHAAIEKFSNPETESYDRYGPRLNRHASALVQEWCDEVLFATYRVHTKTTKEGFDRTRVQAIGQGERVLKTTERPSHLAKNRLNLPDEIPLDERIYRACARGLAPTPDQDEQKQNKPNSD